MPASPGLPPLLVDSQEQIEQALRAHMDGLANGELELYRMMRYGLGWIEQDGTAAVQQPPARLHGALCLEAWSALSPAASRQDGDIATVAAAACELLVASIEVHEQMQVAEQGPRDHPAIWWVWGPAQAINVGNGLHALARLAALGFAARGLSADRTLTAITELDDTALRYYEGQYLELRLQERLDVTEAEYLSVAKQKRGALLGGSMALGALIADAPTAAAQALRTFGQMLGAAAQMQDDIALIWDHPEAELAPMARVLNKSKLYPVVHVLEQGTVKQRRALGRLYYKRVLELSDVDEIRRILEEAGGREAAQAAASNIAEQAVAELREAGLDAPRIGRWQAIADAMMGA
jgi:geranylgeranyl diphosphate synthase type I